MQYTDNYQFREPTPAVDIVKVGDINYNSRKIDELIHSTQVSLAPAYDETRTSSNPYMTGDVVMKDALMYKCLDDDVYGAWDATKWERTTAGEEGAGGSDVEANPQGTPTDDLEKIGINGTIYNIAGSGGGGGNVYGAFVDTNRVIQASTNIPANTDVSYTATEDCAVVWALIASNNGTYSVSVDGEAIASGWTQTGARSNQDSTFLRRGQTITMRQSYGDANGNYTVYGLTFGTQNIFTPQIYSTEEREVGVWIDNKPLYQKSIAFDNTSSNNLSIDVVGLGIDSLIETKLWDKNTGFQVNSYYNTAEDQVHAYYDETGYIHIRRGTSFAGAGYVTLLYTKTTDIAGSGSFNTLGVPARHYDTTEKVVGTVEMDNGIIKPLYEKSWWLTIPSQSGGYTFPNTAMADLDQVISNEYSFGGRGMRSYTYWYAGASVVFDEHTSSGISFYFGSSDYSGRMIFYTARYTKTTD